MKRLQIGYKDRSAEAVKIDENSPAVIMVKPMSQEVMTGMALYSKGVRDRLISSGEKKEFIQSHITDWKDLYDEDGALVEFSTALAVEYLTDEDYDDLFMLLYWKSVELAGDREQKIQDEKEVAKK